MAIIAIAMVLLLTGMGMQLKTLYDAIYAERENLVQTQVASALTILSGFAERAGNGEMTTAEAQKRAFDVLRSIRFGEGDYLFVYDPSGKRLMHPDPKSEGVSAWDAQDTRGTYMIREMIARAGEGGGFTTYYKPRLKGGEEVPKLAYSTRFAPWNITVGAGLYVDDLMAQFMSAAKVAGLVGLLACLLLVACVLPLARSISKPLVEVTGAMRRLASGNTSATVDMGDRRDEIGELADVFETFRKAAIDRDRLESEAIESHRMQALASERQAGIDSEKAHALQSFVEVVETNFARLAEGDLTARMNEPLAREFEPIRETFNTSVAELEKAFSKVMGSVHTIRDGLQEITVASSDLAQRTEKQAANLEQTVAALGDVSGAVGQTADGAGQAQALADGARAKAERGGEVAGKAVAAMSRIEASSQKINQIIGVIDEIAFQTNLLALNAGVEAARAGEAGKGFAVVAQEVRGLAQRSAEAAKEIKQLIATSREQVEQGVELVTLSGHSLEEIVGEVSSMTSLIATIASRAREQAITLREVSGAADQMDKITQQNAAMVEEATAAARSLADETGELSDVVSRFRISGIQQSAQAYSGSAVSRVRSSGGAGGRDIGAAPRISATPARVLSGPAAVGPQSRAPSGVNPVHGLQSQLSGFTSGSKAKSPANASAAPAEEAGDWIEF
ncbi:methyl-accepting chemotaxis protein [Fulvimarina endophytica]|nr:methyl-accepting chemotaxis protein [Fulvimarina endophytica]